MRTLQSGCLPTRTPSQRDVATQYGEQSLRGTEPSNFRSGGQGYNLQFATVGKRVPYCNTSKANYFSFPSHTEPCTMAKIVSPTTRNSSRGESARAAKKEANNNARKSITACMNMISKASALTTKGYERHHVKHDYHDYSRVTSIPSQIELEAAAKASGGVNNPFPTILHKLLSETEQLGFEDIISWQPHGRSFLIHKPKDFVKEVVPKYFQSTKLSSFQRQLSLYGFVRLTNEGPDKGAYYHGKQRQDRTILSVV